MGVGFKVWAAVAALAAALSAALVVVHARRGPSDDGPYQGPPAAPGRPATRPGATRHIALNAEPDDFPRLRALGYDLVDVHPDDWSLSRVPDGMQALLWVGNTTCGPFELPFEEFAATVRRLARHPKVYGWYLSDEPNPGECPEVAGEIRRRADHIRRHAPGQVSFVSLTDWQPMRAVAPARTGVDLVGLDPYPCERKRPGCDIGQIDRMVRMADEAGIPRRVIVPVFQTFGQSCTDGTYRFRLPTEAQLRAILQRWYRLAPNPPMDISYSWGRQREWACPTLADADGRGGLPDLQSVMKEHNAR
ncbi:hypothetical protein Arub01_01980 [Actinomadura rubrobrunea]|uniref:SGNH/GDSL hydrolase family protein n=1 Tax=Actinomadura rubrobrunea TaxID=115335 RepID=A0A9W6UST6_9ACTN|nr:hypothetical protein [Actinomadura rubrobrunea]GLW61954.1 hypothetical protein Arub01_01980 [Actinomadura rubrobrunea]